MNPFSSFTNDQLYLSWKKSFLMKEVGTRRDLEAHSAGKAKAHVVSRAPWIPPVWHYYSITVLLVKVKGISSVNNQVIKK